MRLDQYVAQQWPEYSRSVWQKHISLGNVTINGEPATSAKMVVSSTDDIKISIPEKTSYHGHSIPILHEDDNVIVIDKPLGMLSHSKGELNDEFTVAEFFRSRTTYKSDTNRPGIIHRLDRDTSGVMIGAKNDETAHLLMKQFQDRKVKKIYYAVTSGIPKEPTALLDLPIGRNPSKPSTFRVDASGKSAQTLYEVEQYNDHEALVRLEPKTGRTHQLRVHMAYIRVPICGDIVYGKKDERLFLHAAKLEITIPVSDRRIFESPVPNTFLARFN